MSDATDKPLGWDDEIEKPNEGGGDFTLLPHGCVFPFVVDSMEKQWFSGSANLTACNMAVLKLNVGDQRAGYTTTTDKLKLNAKLEFLLCAFFTAIGQRKSGDPLKMNWGIVPKSQGFCEVGVREYTNRAGEPRRTNEIVKYLSPEEGMRRYELQNAQPLPAIPPMAQPAAAAHTNGGAKPWEQQPEEQEPIPF